MELETIDEYIKQVLPQTPKITPEQFNSTIYQRFLEYESIKGQNLKNLKIQSITEIDKEVHPPVAKHSNKLVLERFETAPMCERASMYAEEREKKLSFLRQKKLQKDRTQELKESTFAPKINKNNEYVKNAKRVKLQDRIPIKQKHQKENVFEEKKIFKKNPKKNDENLKDPKPTKKRVRNVLQEIQEIQEVEAPSGIYLEDLEKIWKTKRPIISTKKNVSIRQKQNQNDELLKSKNSKSDVNDYGDVNDDSLSESDSENEVKKKLIFYDGCLRKNADDILSSKPKGPNNKKKPVLRASKVEREEQKENKKIPNLRNSKKLENPSKEKKLGAFKNRDLLLLQQELDLDLERYKGELTTSIKKQKKSKIGNLTKKKGEKVQVNCTNQQSVQQFMRNSSMPKYGLR